MCIVDHSCGHVIQGHVINWSCDHMSVLFIHSCV